MSRDPAHLLIIILCIHTCSKISQAHQLIYECCVRLEGSPNRRPTRRIKIPKEGQLKSVFQKQQLENSALESARVFFNKFRRLYKQIEIQ